MAAQDCVYTAFSHEEVLPYHLGHDWMGPLITLWFSHWRLELRDKETGMQQSMELWGSTELGWVCTREAQRHEQSRVDAELTCHLCWGAERRGLWRNQFRERIMMCKTKGMRKTLEREGDREGKQKTGRVGDRDITRQNQRQLETQRKRWTVGDLLDAKLSRYTSCNQILDFWWFWTTLLYKHFG